jgi:hypothetical protein
MTTRDQLRRIGISEDRLKNLGMGPPAATRTPSTDPITRARDAHHAAAAEAERASKKAALAGMPDAAIQRHCDAIAVYRQYRSANAVHRAHLRANYGDEIELGRQLDEFEPPEPPKAA